MAPKRSTTLSDGDFAQIKLMVREEIEPLKLEIAELRPLKDLPKKVEGLMEWRRKWTAVSGTIFLLGGAIISGLWGLFTLFFKK